MQSISDAIKQKVLHSPFLEAGLASGIINLSALARQIKPEIESRLVKNASDGAMIMALKRLADELHDDKLLNQDHYPLQYQRIHISKIENDCGQANQAAPGDGTPSRRIYYLYQWCFGNHHSGKRRYEG
jgi:hypothetical protein